MAFKAIRKLAIAQEQEGREKPFWLNVGVLMYDAEKKKFSIKLNALPAGSAWDGWINCFEFDDASDDAPKRNRDGDDAPRRRAPPSRGGDDFSDDIPF